MSVFQPSQIKCEPIFLKAFIVWASEDFATARFLFLRCLQQLHYDANFPHLAICLYLLAISSLRIEQSEGVASVLRSIRKGEKMASLSLTVLPDLSRAFFGHIAEFLQIVSLSKNAYLSFKFGVFSFEPSDDDQLTSHTFDGLSNFLSVSELEDLALFCLDSSLPELALNFTVQAHIDAENICTMPSEGFILSYSLWSRLSSYFRPQLFNSSDDWMPLQDYDTTRMNDCQGTILNRRNRNSILKNSPEKRCFFMDSIQVSNSNICEAGVLHRRTKRVRFALGEMHPPLHIEEAKGGRSNSRRLVDLARRHALYSATGFELNSRAIYSRHRTLLSFTLCSIFLLAFLTLHSPAWFSALCQLISPTICCLLSIFAPTNSLL